MGFKYCNRKKKNSLYFIGIIDILQKYNTKKKLEHGIKSVAYNPNEISAVDPTHYAKRFYKFMKEVIER